MFIGEGKEDAAHTELEVGHWDNQVGVDSEFIINIVDGIDVPRAYVESQVTLRSNRNDEFESDRGSPIPGFESAKIVLAVKSDFGSSVKGDFFYARCR